MKDKMREFSAITEQLISPADLGMPSALRGSAESLTFSSNTDLSAISNANEDSLEEQPKVTSPKPPAISDRLYLQFIKFLKKVKGWEIRKNLNKKLAM